VKIRPLAISGAFEITPRVFPDDRGLFYEEFRGDLLAAELGHRPDLIQANVSVSARGVMRGIHYADVPPSQAKYITALSGALLDYVVDLRVGSETFGRWESVLLDTVDRRAVYLPEGVGHAFVALADDTTAMYLVTATFNPGRERGIHPLDPDIGLRLPEGVDAPSLSAKDEKAPSLAQALAAGELPTWEACDRWSRHVRATRPPA